MKELLRFKYRRVILSFVVVLIIFLSIVVAVIITHQREMFEDSQRNARRELELIGTFTRESLIRRDYANVEQFLKLWGQEHAEVVSIKATAPNNFILVDYTRREPSENSFLVKQHINYEGRDLISLEMVKDITHLKRSLNKFMVQLITGSVLLTIMLGVTLWYALKKLALIPLAKEIATREEAEKKFRMLLESVPDALILVFNDGKIIMVNRAAERLFGYSRAEMLGKEIEMLMPESLREIHRKFREEYLSSPRVRHMGEGLDLFGLAKDGREFPVDIGLSPIDSDEGVFVIADIRDISNRKRAEEKIKRSYHFKSAISSILQISLEPVPMEEQLERILDVILSIPAFSIESKGCIYLVEEEPHVLVMKAESGLPQAVKTSCALVPFASSLCGMAVSERKIMFSECIDDRHEIHHENMFPHGHYCIPVISGDIVLGAINLFVKEGHKRDKEEEDLLISIANTIAGIIERKKTELEKEKLQEQLIQSETLSALGRVTANVAHDIRNPLTVIGGYVRRLNKTILDGTKEKEYAEMIITEVDRLEKILRNVLIYSKHTSPDKEIHDINETVNESLKIYELICKEQSIKIEKSLAALPEIMIDKDKAEEALNNIISNAMEAMPEGGILTIATGKEDIKERAYLKIEITDTGGGIPEENIKLIFEPFYSTRVAGHGAGLGLSICKKIMEDQGGFIRAESIVGKGSTFIIYFPC